MRSAFETASNTVRASLEISEVNSACGTSRSCFFLTIGAAGVGRPSERTSVQRSEIGGQKASSALTPAYLTSDL
jgi:hypothetical protein